MTIFHLEHNAGIWIDISESAGANVIKLYGFIVAVKFWDINFYMTLEFCVAFGQVDVSYDL